jgi:hypothetical protein
MAVALDFQQFRGWKAFLQTRKTTSANTYFNSYNYVAKQAFPARFPCRFTWEKKGKYLCS